MTIERYNLLGYAPKGYPVRHKRKVPFEPSILVPDEYPARARRIRTIDFELGRFILGETDLMRLVIDAFTSNVHWSTKLEGNPLSEVEVRRITTRTMTGAREKKGREKIPGPRQEIVNHISCLVAPSQFRLPWTHEHMLKLNRYLLKGTGEDQGSEGYKTEQNAVYSDAGAEIFVPTPPMHVRDEMRSLLDWVNGPARAFDPIFTTKTLGKGTGLGLSICYSIMQRLGGSISVKSQVGEGTEFTVTIPYQPSAQVQEGVMATARG